MRGAKQGREYVTLTEALSWIAFRTLMDAGDIKERLRSDLAAWVTLEEAMQQFSIHAGDGLLRARGRFMTDVDDSDQAKAGYTDSIPENLLNDLQQFDLDRERLQYRPPNGSRVLCTWGVPASVSDPNGVLRTETKWLGKAEECSERAFQSYAGVTEKNRPNYSAGYENVEVTRADLLKQFPAISATPKARRGRPPEIDRGAVCARAKELREQQSDISLTSTAASISAELATNPKTGKPWDARGIERIIAPLWRSREDK